MTLDLPADAGDLINKQEAKKNLNQKEQRTQQGRRIESIKIQTTLNRLEGPGQELRGRLDGKSDLI